MPSNRPALGVARPDRRRRYTAPTIAHHRRTPCPATVPPPEDPRPVHVRVVTAQPWEVAADVLVVPVVGDPDFEGPLGELDRRTGGELRALAAVRRAQRQALRDVPCGARRAAGRTACSRSASATRPTARPRDRPCASARPRIRRLVGREVRLAGRLARRRSPTASAGRRGTAAELVARGVVEGAFEPATIYREDSRRRAAGARRADPRRSGHGRRPRLTADGRRARPDHRRGREHRPHAREPRRQRRHARRSSPTRRARSRRSTACGST